jgi:hypothetical protein
MKKQLLDSKLWMINNKGLTGYLRLNVEIFQRAKLGERNKEIEKEIGILIKFGF